MLIGMMLCFGAVVGIGYHQLSRDIRNVGINLMAETMLDGYKSELKDIVDVMALSLSAASIEMTDENQIHDFFTRQIKPARFFPDQSGYFFIYKKGGVVFTHAAQPHLEGKNLIDFKDPKGNLLIKKLDQAARAGGGYVAYDWEKPGQGITPKLSYARIIPGTEYWIGTGVYIDDVAQKKQQMIDAVHTLTQNFLKRLQIFLGAVLIFVIAPLTWLLVRGIIGPVKELTDVANTYSLGNLDLKIPAKERKDEIGDLAMAIDRLGTSIKLAMKRLTSLETVGSNTKETDNRIWNKHAGPRNTPPQALVTAGNEITPAEKAQITILLFDYWELHWSDQLSLLGLNDAGPETLARISTGNHIPDSADFRDRIELFVKIYKELRIGISTTTILKPSWIKEENAFFNKRTPLGLIQEKGISGLTEVADIICQVASKY